ncbi:unnamed protein product [Lactuca virosa]|uniref:Pentatricopeptide repeat-containing protein n=1 Tax=Lactuca virosa TaxID=75947 RepID=A0AAU9PK85_9ASTR|nr:unnamed protein product [Lactuca virosa]
MIALRRFRFTTRVPCIRASPLGSSSYSSDSVPEPLPSYPFDLHSSSDLIRKQHWSALKILTKSTNPDSFLQQLYDWGAPYDVVLGYLKWSHQEFQVMRRTQRQIYVSRLLIELVITG